jgi:hypothetical protein
MHVGGCQKTVVRRLPRKTFAHKTLAQKTFALKDIYPPDICPKDVFPERHLPKRHLPKRLLSRNTFAQKTFTCRDRHCARVCGSQKTNLKSQLDMTDLNTNVPKIIVEAGWLI